MHLHRASVAQCVELMASEDQRALDAVREAGPAITAFIEAVEPGFALGGRVVYVGAGTSGRLGVLDSSEIPPTFQAPPGRFVGLIAGGDSALRTSSEGMEDDPRGALDALQRLDLTNQDSVLAIAAGGTTPYALGTLVIARELASRCVVGLLSCSDLAPGARSLLPGGAHELVVRTGPEVLTGSTRLKAGTATKLVLNTISTTLMVRSGRVYENLMVDVRASNAKLRDRAARIVSTLTGLSRDQAVQLLFRADLAVKTAVVMHRRGVERDEAQRLLDAASGRLGEVIDGHSGGDGTGCRTGPAH